MARARLGNFFKSCKLLSWMHAAVHQQGAEIHRESTKPMDANSGEPWSEADISDLKNELDHGRTIAETASFLCRDVFNQADQT